MICEITDFCNLKCSFCYESIRRKRKHIHPRIFKNILKKYRPLYLQITGGEATTHPKFEEIISIGIKNSIKVQISTNGVLLKKIMGLFLNIPFRKRPIVGVSLDAIGEEHDIIRGRKGLYKNIINSLIDYKKNKIPFGFAVTIFDKNHLSELPEGNLKHVPRLIELAEKFQAPINIQPCAPTNRKLRMKLGDLLIKSKSRYLVNTQPYRKVLIKGHNGKCKYTWTNVSIDTSGEVLPTSQGNCYFCNDCLKCYYSCVWEPSLITSRHMIPSLKSFLNQALILM
ncbi:MAG: radical SAM protein [Candidatus Helarchaeota archaeon]